MTKLTICMYAAASDRIDSIYINAAEALGKEIAKRHHKLIYGGGASGLMGACANGVLENGGEVTGVVPTFMNKLEPIKSECTERSHGRERRCICHRTRRHWNLR